MTRVISVNEIECASGVSAQEFEAFMLDKFIPLYEQVPGQKLSLLKGERGERTGKYLVIMEFESKEIRDQIYPRPNVGSEELMRILKSAGSFFKERDTIIASRIFTDYEQIDRQQELTSIDYCHFDERSEEKSQFQTEISRFARNDRTQHQ